MIILTLVTQVGGFIWICVFGVFKFRFQSISRLRKILAFLIIYLVITLLLVPQLAKLNNRVALPVFKSGNLIPHNLITPLLNRHYVRPKLKRELIKISDKVNSHIANLKISYLDANFPFVDGFPLLPHLSHNDGRKIDLCFYYKLNSRAGILKPSNSGYGKYVEPKPKEPNYNSICKSKGYWQYDFTKHLTLGSRQDLEFDLSNTRYLVSQIVNNPFTQKLLIEPHLKDRMKLTHDKVRFQGCHAVRHDDHIHYQIN